MEENKNAWVWAFAVVALLLLFSSFGMGGYGTMGLGMGFGFLFMLLLWGVLIGLVVTLINAAQSQKSGDSAICVLKRRYASGEISKKQFEGMKKEIERWDT